jgi:hypothetical protein
MEKMGGLEGRSLVPNLEDTSHRGKPAAFTYQRNRITMRTDRYRLMAHEVDDRVVVALFDHEHDPYETKNIAREFPDIVNSLLPLLESGNQDFMGPITHWRPD